MEINWTVLAYIFIGLFALSGFFKGWWKEVITTYFLLVLVLLLYFSFLAQLFIAVINFVFALIARVLSNDWKIALANWLETGLGIPTVDGTIQLDPTNGGTWLVILVIFVGLGIFLGRFLLPANYRPGVKILYRPLLMASLLGALIGAFNGFLIVSLVLAYIGGGTSSGLSTATAEATSVLRAVAMPGFTLTESVAPWIFVALSSLLIVAVFRSRIDVKKDKENYRKLVWVSPLGHDRYDVTKKKEEKK